MDNVKRIKDVYVQGGKNLVVKYEDNQGYYHSIKFSIEDAIELKEYISELL